MAVPNYHATIVAVLAAAIDSIKAILDDATLIIALSGEAANYADATTNFGTGSGKRLAAVAVGPGDFALSGAGLARVCTFAGKTGGTAYVAADPVAFAFVDTVNSVLLAQVAESGAVAVDLARTVTFPALTLISLTGPTTV